MRHTERHSCFHSQLCVNAGKKRTAAEELPTHCDRSVWSQSWRWQDLCSGAYVQAPLPCLQGNQAFNLQDKTPPPANTCASSQQPPKPQTSPTPKCRCTHTHTHTHTHTQIYMHTTTPMQACCQLSTAALLPLTALTTATRPPKM